MRRAPDPRTNHFRRLLRELQGEVDNLTPPPCGLRLPTDVLGFAVHPCHEEKGHGGEHRGHSHLMRLITWEDA